MRLLTIFRVVSEVVCKERTELRPSIPKRCGGSFGIGIWAFQHPGFLIPSHFAAYPAGPFHLHYVLKLIFLFCLSVCYYRDHSDLCFRWISKILTYAQGAIHSWVLHFLFYHGIPYDHSGNDTVFEHHFLSPVPLWWPFSSLARSSCKIVSWIALNEWRHWLSLKVFFFVWTLWLRSI